MADTGWKSPGTAANVDRDGQTAWADVDNIKDSDDNYASQMVLKEEYTDWIRATNFDFASDIPAGATIDGIELQIEHKSEGANIKDSAIYLRKTAGQVGDNKSLVPSWPIADAYATYGGAADTWNAGLTDVDVRNLDFGVDISAYCWQINDYWGYVDHVQIRVYYTGGLPGTPSAYGGGHIAIKMVLGGLI